MLAPDLPTYLPYRPEVIAPARLGFCQFRLTSAEAYYGDSGVLAASIAEHLTLSDETLTLLHSCLHEALVNAVVHGNLEVQMVLDSPAALGRYYAHIAERLENPAYRQRPITVSATQDADTTLISVSDQGKTPIPTVARMPLFSPQGRGLAIIHAMADRVWTSSAPSTLHMEFIH